MEKKFIQPKFDSFEIVTEWGEESSKWWAKEVQIWIEDVTECGLVRKRKDGGSVGEVFFLIVCSPDFKANPNDEVDEDDITKALVLDRFEKAKVTAYLQSVINRIGRVDVRIFEHEFRGLFNMSDWDSELLME